MDVKSNGRAVRTSVNLLWTGEEPVTLPKTRFDAPARTLKPGINPDLPIEVLHDLGNYPEWIERIASGELKAVCIDHVFLDSDYHCLNCGENRDSVAEKAAALAKATKSGVADSTGDAHV